MSLSIWCEAKIRISIGFGNVVVNAFVISAIMLLESVYSNAPKTPCVAVMTVIMAFTLSGLSRHELATCDGV